MQEKKKQYILDDLLRIILAMFVLTVLFAKLEKKLDYFRG